MQSIEKGSFGVIECILTYFKVECPEKTKKFFKFIGLDISRYFLFSVDMSVFYHTQTKKIYLIHMWGLKEYLQTKIYLQESCK